MTLDGFHNTNGNNISDHLTPDDSGQLSSKNEKRTLKLSKQKDHTCPENIEKTQGGSTSFVARSSWTSKHHQGGSHINLGAGGG